MTYYKNPITRYLLRRGFLHRVAYRLRHYKRVLTKDLLTDITSLMKGRNVSVILDVGANVGFMTFQFQRRFPDAEIYCFEPNPNVFVSLKNNYINDNHIHCYPVGVGDMNGELTFNINANTGTSSFSTPTKYHQAHQARRILSQQTVPVVTLDAFVQEQSIRHVDILKLDIEGYEMKALHGASNLLDQQRIDVIYSEVNIVRSYDGQAVFHELTTFLDSRDYHLFNLEGFVAQETPIRQAILGNAVYFSGNFRQFLEDRHGKENCGW
jgi:FkbM family methyltransferase